ncbi:hypothetical protein Asulf_01814 [Archaeoglobus sulfaticallidus PM70-1]|uniref:Eight-cysteine-cluster domain-containing protein n=1 Tax=Archaeoglobus sulfaticallidus PM70-1 TaxID=387631 RepID=N0BN99_9EURY|nr:eight-cysteine-cluster domain-containing protein [Archaeoglobus sulfaticallidus]AGK61785.1 hypothetical protein Asulf_01814 [Archaeoglobus sulfaticallidus PM70-1]
MRLRFLLLIVIVLLMLGCASEEEHPAEEESSRIVEKIIEYDHGKPRLLNESEERTAEKLLLPKLHKINVQARCVFDESTVEGIKQSNFVIEIIFREPISITTSLIDDGNYRVIENVSKALFVVNGSMDIILLLSGKMYSCWKIEGQFCGRSTYGKCENDNDCVVDGCSSQICRSVYEEPVITTCEWKDCYDSLKYGYGCKCVNQKCQWVKLWPN